MANSNPNLGTRFIEVIERIQFPALMILFSGVFIVFSLAFNDRYIYYGFITFLYGLVDYGTGVFLRNLSGFLGGKNERMIAFLYSLIQYALLFLYILVLILISK